MRNYMTSEATNSLSDPDEELSNAVSKSESPRNSYEYITNILKTEIRMDFQEVKRNKKILREFFEELKKVLKVHDEMFAALFQDVYYTGSYYDGLRISCAREFDLNFILKFPFPEYKITAAKIEGFSVYQVSEAEFTSFVNSLAETSQKIAWQIYKEFFVGGYLMPSKVKNWLKRIFTTGQVDRMKIDGVEDIRPSESGPAKTMILKTVDGYEIDIDIVPVVKSSEWPPGADKSVLKIANESNRNKKAYEQQRRQQQNENSTSVKVLNATTNIDQSSSAKKKKARRRWYYINRAKRLAQEKAQMMDNDLDKENVKKHAVMCQRNENIENENHNNIQSTKTYRRRRRKPGKKIPVDTALYMPDQCWFLVPKSYAGTQDISSVDAERMWRNHFPGVEQEILYNKGCAKPVIKLLKLLRDSEGWESLASYYLKTVVMWVVKKNPDSNYWKPNNTWARFVECLKRLRQYVNKGKIPYLFYPQYNLIEKMKRSEARNISYRLRKIISKVELDYKNLGLFINKASH